KILTPTVISLVEGPNREVNRTAIVPASRPLRPVTLHVRPLMRAAAVATQLIAAVIACQWALTRPVQVPNVPAASLMVIVLIATVLSMLAQSNKTLRRLAVIVNLISL